MTSSAPESITTSPAHAATAAATPARLNSTTGATESRGNRPRLFSEQLQQSLAATQSPSTALPPEAASQSDAATLPAGQAGTGIETPVIGIGNPNDPAPTPGPGELAKSKISLTNGAATASAADPASSAPDPTITQAAIAQSQQQSPVEKPLPLTPSLPPPEAILSTMMVPTPSNIPPSPVTATLAGGQTPTGNLTSIPLPTTAGTEISAGIQTSAGNPIQNGAQPASGHLVPTNLLSAATNASSLTGIPNVTQGEVSDAQRAMLSNTTTKSAERAPSGLGSVSARSSSPDQSRAASPRATASAIAITSPTFPSIGTNLATASQTTPQGSQNAVASNAPPSLKPAPTTQAPVQPPNLREASITITRGSDAAGQGDPATDASSTTAKAAASAKSLSAPTSTSAATDPALVKLPDLASMPNAATSQSASSTDTKPITLAEQVAQAVIVPTKVSLADARAQAAGPQVLTIQLHPVELGRVEIRIERTGDGPAKIQLAAEKPETLQRLIHDQAQLNQVLDQAGIPSAGRTLQFSLSTDTGSSGSPSPNFADGNPGGANGNNNNNGNGQKYSQSNSADLAQETAALRSSTLGGARSGVDITA